MLSGQLKTLPDEQVNELVAESKSLIDNARKLTDDLITWAQLQMKQEEAHPSLFTATEAVQNVMTVFKELAAKKQITINHTIDPTLQLFADKNQYLFIIRNLVNNAVKFTPAGGSITISGTTNGTTTSIAVTDTGTGMSNEVADSIFRVGKLKSKNGTAGEPGTGLGLILVHEFVLLNKGEIKVTSELGKGSTFFVTVPATA
jgi:signal transduction histidine kinase